MDHGKILKFVRNKVFYFFFIKRAILFLIQIAKKNKISREKNVLNKKKKNCYD